MFIRLIISLFLICIAGVTLAPSSFCAPIDDWNGLILEGSKYKIEGKYDLAIQSFTKALSFAQKQKLPDKCLPISLCRVAEVELITNDVKEADSHFEQITNLIKTQKNDNKLDPQVSFWAAALADAYESNLKADTRELCLKHACYLKTLAYGVSHRECVDCLSKLADCYINGNKIDKAVSVLAFRQALLDKQYGKDPDGLGDTLNNLAIRFENAQKYEQAKQLELATIQTAQSSTSAVNAGLPSFYFFLGINALDQKKAAEAENYFRRATHEVSKIKGSERLRYAAKYLSLVPPIINENEKKGKSQIAVNEYKHLLPLYKIIFPDREFDLLAKLAQILYYDNSNSGRAERLCEAERYGKKCIQIAELPNSVHKNSLRDLYTQLASYECPLHKIDQANENFAEALEIEKDKSGIHYVVILFWWGCELRRLAQNDAAAEKLNLAYKKVVILPPAERGTVLADLLLMLSNDARDHHNFRKAQQLFQQSTAEIQLQKKLHSKIGPDQFHRM